MMLSKIKKFKIREFFEERTLVLIDGLLLALIGAFGNNVIAFFQSPAFDLRLAQVVIIILTIIAFGALSYHLYLKRSGKLKEDKKETTIDVYSQNNLDKQITTTLKTILSNKGKIKILICDPNNKLMNEIEKIVYSTIGNHNTSQKITTTLTTFKNIMNESNGIIEIKTYNIIPTNTMIIVNPDDDSGFMQIEPYTYGIDREDRRVFTISKSSQKNLFDVYLSSYKKIWNDAQQSTNQTS